MDANGVLAAIFDPANRALRVSADALTLTEAQVTNLVADLAAKLAKASNLSDLADAPTARTNLGLGTAATQAIAAFDAAGVAAAAQAASQPLDSDLTAIAALTTTAFGRSFLALADVAAAQALVGFDPANRLPTAAVTQPAGSSSILADDLELSDGIVYELAVNAILEIT